MVIVGVHHTDPLKKVLKLPKSDGVYANHGLEKDC